MLASLALACAAPAAQADLWGYIDEHGQAHFATRRVDDRYQLFFRGGSTLDAPAFDSVRANALARLERSPLYRRVVDHPNVKRYTPLIEQHARAAAVDVALVKAMIAVESAFDPLAVSSRGAVGLMQVLPDTAARYGLVDNERRTVAQQLLDPTTNVRVGVRYLRDLLRQFGNDTTLAVAAYNAGEQAVRQYGDRIPPFAETQEYVSLVQQFVVLYRPLPPATVPSGPPRLVLPPRPLPSPQRAL